ncbi:uncharacterized protein LOC111884187 [Lactuca sativa]|uniref:uncharacterized protein LOC111884187 n=1 Tax=Lactuca sativa TaxID=4236 RepID=UPI0022AF7521|nr:uncharacterized protein LOC111884187 [Lactuca sativa]
MSCVESDFMRHMETIKKLSPSAYEYLMSRQPKTWCRAYFDRGYACEAVENGISECFNSIIVDARKKPLITMLEEIRIYIMDRFSHMIEENVKWKSNVCPAILRKMQLFGKNMRLWVVVHSQGHVFEARRGCDSYMVDLDSRTCSCRLWDLSGIPCVHANAAINYINQTPDVYIDGYFSKENFKKSYSSNIKPVNGSNLWSQTGFIKPLPPLARRMPGRPTTKRKRHASEQEGRFSSTRVFVPRTVRCGKCLEYGHNQKSCKNEKKPVVPLLPKKRGRPRKHPLLTEYDESLRASQSSQPPMQKNKSKKEASSSKVLKASRSKKEATEFDESLRASKSSQPLKKKNKSKKEASSSKVLKASRSKKEATSPHKEDVSATQKEVVDGIQIGEGDGIQNEDHGDSIEPGDHGDDIQIGEGGGIETGGHGDDIQTGDVNDVIVEDCHIVEEVEVVDVGKEDVLLPRVGLDLHKVLDEVEQGLDEILGEGSFQQQSETYDATQSDYEGNVEFNDGKADGVLVDKVKLDAEQIASMLEAGYSMEEIEGMEGVELELDDMLPVELDMEDVLDHPSDNDDEAVIDDVDGIVDGGGEQEEGGDDGHLGDDEGEQEERGDDEGPDDVPRLTRLRKPSERIILQKLKKTVLDKNGGGSSASNPVRLE